MLSAAVASGPNYRNQLLEGEKEEEETDKEEEKKEWEKEEEEMEKIGQEKERQQAKEEWQKEQVSRRGRMNECSMDFKKTDWGVSRSEGTIGTRA